MRYRPIAERFSEKYKVNTKTGCWDWIATKVTGGYGMLSPDRRNSDYQRNVLAHRFSYEHHIGPVPAGMIVCHNCDNPSCVNPEHLFLSTTKGNMEDMEGKGRARILSKEKVRLAQSLLRQGHSQTWVAEYFAVNRSTLQRAMKLAARGDYGPEVATELVGKYVRVSEDDKAAIRALLTEGISVSEVARRFNIDRKHVRTIRDRR
jgi:transposase-like protein